MAGLRVHVVMPPDLVELVDRAKAPGESRGAFVRRALEQALAAKPGGQAVSTAQGRSSEFRPVGAGSTPAEPVAKVGVPDAAPPPGPASARASFVKPFEPRPKSG